MCSFAKKSVRSRSPPTLCAYIYVKTYMKIKYLQSGSVTVDFIVELQHNKMTIANVVTVSIPSVIFNIFVILNRKKYYFLLLFIYLI